MKKIKVITQPILFGLSVALMMMFSSCSKKMMFSSSEIVPAAMGSVKIKSDKNKNQTIEVKVRNLAPSSKLTPPKNTYVVWMVSKSNGTKNIGQLKSSSRKVSKALKGSLKTVSSFYPTSFFITAEDNGNIEYPEMPIVLTTR